MAIVAYVRVSTDDQTTSNQTMAIAEAGYKVDKVFADDGVSGKTEAESRAGWGQCLEYLREGDTLVIAAMDRIGRSVLDVLRNVEVLQKKGVIVISLREGFDLTTPMGKAMMTMMVTFAEMELAIGKERREAGIQRAKAEGKYKGRPANQELHEAIVKMHGQGVNKMGIAKALKVSRTTVYSVLSGV